MCFSDSATVYGLGGVEGGGWYSDARSESVGDWGCGTGMGDSIDVSG